MQLKFFSSKDVHEEHVLHSKSNNIEFMPYDNASEVVNEHFESLLSRYQIGFGTSMKDSDFFSNQFNFSIKIVTR